MERKKRIFESKYILSSELANRYKKREEDFLSLDLQNLSRNELFKAREINRPKKELHEMALERAIGPVDNSKEYPPSITARKNGIPVCRLFEMGAVDEPKGFGSGFLIAPNILITNNHVFPNEEMTYGCVANFGFERKQNSKTIDNGISFKLRGEIFFHKNKNLDYSLVYVEENAIGNNSALTELDFLPLIKSKGKVRKKSELNIIQYPNGFVKKYTTEDNFVTEIDDSIGVVYYSTDTEKGSSGSPCFNKFWEVAALHFTGVPKTDQHGNWLTKNGGIWNKDIMTDDEVDWIANAGISISKIVEDLRLASNNNPNNQYLKRVLEFSQDPLKVESSRPQKTTTSMKKETSNDIASGITMNFYSPVEININPSVGLPENTLTGLISENTVERKKRYDENYLNRRGYDEYFLPDFKVPFPKVKKEIENQMFKKNGSKNPYIIPYHNFSLTMNKERRMLMWSAANVDYNPKHRDNRDRSDFGDGEWREDKRVPTEYQILDLEFYKPATLIDRGHMVRRDDNVWAYQINGKTNSLGIEYANSDTFHWTNCTPQHEAFNRDVAQYKGVGKWGIMENAIKRVLEKGKTNNDYGQRACVLSGPIYDKNDPEYLGIQYPLEFWKVFAIVNKSKEKIVYGFILSQKDKVLKSGLEREAKPRFSRKVRMMQKSLKEIELKSGVVFDRILHKFDVKAEDDKSIDLEDSLENFKWR